MPYCENCGQPTENKLVAECGYSYICEECADEEIRSQERTNSDGVKYNLYTDYHSKD